MEATIEETIPADTTPAPTQPKRDVTIQLVNGFNIGGKVSKALHLTGDENIGQDQLGISVTYPNGDVTWIPNHNIAVIQTTPKA